MAENTFKRMMKDPAFDKWFNEFKQSANYFVAGDSDALRLCVAYAFEAGQLSPGKTESEDKK